MQILGEMIVFGWFIAHWQWLADAAQYVWEEYNFPISVLLCALFFTSVVAVGNKFASLEYRTKIEARLRSSAAMRADEELRRMIAADAIVDALQAKVDEGSLEASWVQGLYKKIGHDLQIKDLLPTFPKGRIQALKEEIKERLGTHLAVPLPKEDVKTQRVNLFERKRKAA